MNLNKVINRRPSEINIHRTDQDTLVGNDQIKPNFIYSSDIPRKVASLIHSISKSRQKRISEECGNGCSEITVNIELNALVSRRSANLIALLQRNLISVVQKSGDSNVTQRQSYLYNIITSQKQNNLQPDVLRTKDVFVVTFKLIVSEFDYFGNFILEEDENFLLLQSCDPRGELVNEIKRYIKETFTILRNQCQNKAKNDGSHSDVSDSTLDCSEDDAMYLADEIGGAHIEPLVSNETLTDEFRRRFSDISDEEKGLKFRHTFLENINNLRHNDEDKELNVDGEQVLFHNETLKQPIKFSPLTPEDHIHLDDLIEVSYEETDKEYTDDFQVHRFSSSSPKKEFEDDDEIMKFSRKSSFQSPTKRRAVSRMSSSHSVSMINTDDKYGLPFAYNSDSAAVPSYIKQNKKFKFIKVGKVQKFVHLFEEQNQSEKK
ncbi:Cta9 protein [Candida orthopsilosis Co 90-125]|uniref:Cta9 protein n=1 Tax=Candida orthopsilosis (strain 90-125) TaxID=1136231 RepID=H8X262_CANO9|nr:Cta9 protein [Candida orthopsilosis Co 90-125]CCG22783.1 Cta9 protein [Candida orthopsilosis Co 90-125]